MGAEGSLRDAVERLRSDAGLLRRSPWVWKLVRGDDREAYLHRMTSQVIEGLPPDAATYACVLTPQGKVLGDPLIWNLGDALALDLDARAAADAIPALERYVITDDVTFEEPHVPVARFVLGGDRAADRLAAVGVEAPAEGRWVAAKVGEHDARVLRRDLGSVPAFEIALPESGGAALSAWLGVAEVGADVWAAVRVAEGVPAYGHELDPRTMPLEARLEDRAVAFGKGCYPGQEPVVMAHHRGKPAHLLVRLDVDDDRGLAQEASLLRDGRPVGRVTTALPAGAIDGPRALALVRHALAVEGEVLDLEGGGRVRVRTHTGPGQA